ncbi:hypothetical protein ONZ43_g3377 [Nemania bipapillata]|uniref:Uncharacterized protein n=1 Tax=Nemania bipapillata TaxID=110536 RepID=A0ACC2IX28_9PEZI|nr:hypothetical protein ONZ43_g3377 [Nemania bipapillata]
MGSPSGSSSATLTKAGSSTPAHNPPSPDVTPSKSMSSPKTTLAHPIPQEKRRKRNGPKKKQKQDEAAAEKARIVAEKEAIKATKATEKATKAAEKARADAEKEALKAAKAAEKAKVDAVKEAKRQKKQEEELAAKAKKEKQQNLMASFLKKAPTTSSRAGDHLTTVPKADTASPCSSRQEEKPKKSTYELNFKPFFVKPGVTMAAPLFAMDDETKEAKSAILDEYIRGDRGEFTPKHPFNATEVFHLAFPQQRGIIPPSVKKIMERIHGDNYQNAFGITNARTESQTEKLFTNAQDQLNNIPMKYIRFYEDVRPAYFGTITTPMTYHQLRKLSRRPAGRILSLAYDYDSEAEWVEDDGEDLEDAEDDEEDVDGDEEMDDFVDDSEAIPTIIRPGFETDSMPVSSGLCYENQKRLGPSPTVYKYRLEFLLEVKDGVPRDILEDFKRALLSDECKDYSKATVIEMLAKKFTSCTKAQVKVTLDTIAHRVTPAEATKKSVKRWALLPNFGLKGT